MKRRGFTTIEVIIVVMIIAILAVVGFPKMGEMIEGYRARATRAALDSLRSQISVCHDRNASWPAVTDIQAPLNAVTGSRVINPETSRPTATTRDFGWYYESANGHVWAANDTMW